MTRNLRRLSLLLPLALLGCDQTVPERERWVVLMNERHFSIEQLQFDAQGGMHATEGITGRQLEYRKQWNHWVDVEQFAPLHPPPPRPFDGEGNVYAGPNGIWRKPHGDGAWSQLPGSLEKGLSLLAVDAAGTVVAFGPTAFWAQPKGATTWTELPVPRAGTAWMVDAQGTVHFTQGASGFTVSGAQLTPSDPVVSLATVDPKGRQLTVVSDGVTFAVHRKPIVGGSDQVLMTAPVPQEAGSAVRFGLIGCGETRCFFNVGEGEIHAIDVGQAALTHIASLQIDSAGNPTPFTNTLNVIRLVVGSDDQLYAYESYGAATLPASFVCRLQLGTSGWGTP